MYVNFRTGGTRGKLHGSEIKNHILGHNNETFHHEQMKSISEAGGYCGRGGKALMEYISNLIAFLHTTAMQTALVLLFFLFIDNASAEIRGFDCPFTKLKKMRAFLSIS